MHPDREGGWARVQDEPDGQQTRVHEEGLVKALVVVTFSLVCAVPFAAIQGSDSRVRTPQDADPLQCGRVVVVSCEGPSSLVTLSLRSVTGSGGRVSLTPPGSRSSTWRIGLPSEIRREPGPRVEDRYEGRTVCVPKAALSSSIARLPVVDPRALTVNDLVGPALSLPADVFRSCDPDVEPPQPLRMVKPSYTAEAMRAKVQGAVVLLGVVNRNGAVGRVSILEPLEPGLDAEAERAFAQWRFQPATRHGEPVALALTVDMSFTLR